MTDKLMDTVIREHGIQCGLCKKGPVGSCIDCVDKAMRKACRMYARKVVEGLEKDNILWMKVESNEEGVTTSQKAYIWCEAITKLLDRLDKEPT